MESLLLTSSLWETTKVIMRMCPALIPVLIVVSFISFCAGVALLRTLDRANSFGSDNDDSVTDEEDDSQDSSSPQPCQDQADRETKVF